MQERVHFIDQLCHQMVMIWMGLFAEKTQYDVVKVSSCGGIGNISQEARLCTVEVPYMVTVEVL